MTATNGRLLLHASLIFLFLAATDNAAGKLGLSEDIAIGSIVITELMPNVSDKDVDWIELLNVTDTDIDLKGCSLTDTNNDKVLIEQALTIPAGKYAILASGISDENNTPPALSKPALLYSAESFHLDNHTDQVILTCSERVIDEVSYKQYQPGPASPSRGWQLEPNSLNATANDETDKWCYTVLSDDFIYGVDRAATPGAENPMCVEVSLPYVHINDQSAVLIDGIDFNTTLKIAAAELAENKSTSELTIWVLRDQKINAEIATTISLLYFQHIEDLYDSEPFTVVDWNHAVWHFAWAISNLYRNGDESVKATLQQAYDDATTRPQTLARYNYIAADNVLNPAIMMGDIHTMGRGYANNHIVVPGNPEYIQDYQGYLDNKRSDLMSSIIHVLYVVKKFFDDLMA